MTTLAQFSLDTRAWPNGPHAVAVGIRQPGQPDRWSPPEPFTFDNPVGEPQMARYRIEWDVSNQAGVANAEAYDRFLVTIDAGVPTSTPLTQPFLEVDLAPGSHQIRVDVAGLGVPPLGGQQTNVVVPQPVLVAVPSAVRVIAL